MTTTPSARRRALLALGAGTWLVPGGAFAADTAGAAVLIEQAERALRDGRPEAASGVFERAARLDDESATAELGMLRAALQTGDYLQAVAWGRLVAGEHTDSAEAAAWADAVEALARPNAAPAAPPGVAPLPGPAAARPARLGEVLGCGLVDGARGRLLASPATMRRVADGDRPWVIDGTGTAWRLSGTDGAPGTAWRESGTEGALVREARAEAEPAASARLGAVKAALARPGRPVLVLHPGPAPRDAAAWPRLAPALLTFPTAGERRLGVALTGTRPVDGSPVFDACGHWLGWTEGDRLEQAPGADAAVACNTGPAADVAGVYGRWYAAVGVIHRAG